MKRILIAVCVLFLVTSMTAGGRVRNFEDYSRIGCQGRYDLPKFARVDKICDECYHVYRDLELQTSCRKYCYRNDVFDACVETVLRQHDRSVLNAIINDLNDIPDEVINN